MVATAVSGQGEVVAGLGWAGLGWAGLAGLGWLSWAGWAGADQNQDHQQSAFPPCRHHQPAQPSPESNYWRWAEVG